MPNGEIQPEFIDTLKAIGKWLQQYGETIYGTRGNIIAPQDWGVVTTKDKLIFAHILKKPSQTYIFIPCVQQKINKVSLMVSKNDLEFKQEPEGVFVETEEFRGIIWIR